MMRTVDLVIAGDGSAARIAAAGALGRGERVLVVLRSADARVARRVRKCLCKVGRIGAGRLAVMTNAEVVCVDGLDGVEAVVLRHAPAGRLSAVNTSAFVSFEASWRSGRPHSQRTE